MKNPLVEKIMKEYYKCAFYEDGDSFKEFLEINLQPPQGVEELIAIYTELDKAEQMVEAGEVLKQLHSLAPTKQEAEQECEVLYRCNRVREARQMGTMTEADFEEVVISKEQIKQETSVDEPVEQEECPECIAIGEDNCSHHCYKKTEQEAPSNEWIEKTDWIFELFNDTLLGRNTAYGFRKTIEANLPTATNPVEIEIKNSDSEYKYCPKCNQPMININCFCPGCGAKIKRVD